MLFGVRPGDPLVLVAGCVVLAIAGVAAAYLPALTRRVGGSDAGAADGVIGDRPQSQSSWGLSSTAVPLRAAGRANAFCSECPLNVSTLRQNF